MYIFTYMYLMFLRLFVGIMCCKKHKFGQHNVTSNGKFVSIYICMVGEVKVFMPRHRCISWHCYKHTCTFLWKGEGSLRSRRKGRAYHFVNVRYLWASEESSRSRRKGHCFRACHCVDTPFFYHLSWYFGKWHELFFGSFLALNRKTCMCLQDHMYLNWHNSFSITK